MAGPDPFAPPAIPGAFYLPQPNTPASLTPAFLGNVSVGTQLFYSSATYQASVVADLGSTLTISSLVPLSLYPFKLLLEWGTPNQEVVYITQAPTGNGPYTYTNVLRGQDGGGPKITHAAGAQVNHGVSAQDFAQVAPVFNVCAYGADPTGTLFSDAAFAAAFAAAKGVHPVYAPSGNYKIQTQLDPLVSGTYASAYFYGDGPASTIITQTNSTANGIALFGTTVVNVTIRDMRLNGTPVTGASGCGFIAAAAGGNNPVVALMMSNVIIYAFSSHGFYAQNLITSVINGVQSVNNLGRGFWLYNGTSTSLVSCYANTNPYERGFYLQYMLYSGLFACASDGNAIGYELLTCDNVNIVNSGAELTLAYAGIDGTSFKINNCSSTAVRGGRALTNKAVGIWFTAASTECSVDGFTETAGTGATASMKVDTGCYVTAANYVAATAQSFAANTTSILNNYGYTYFPTAEVGAFLADNVAQLLSGSDTNSIGASVTSPAFTSGTALQLSTAQDQMLYITVKTSGTYVVAIGPTSGVANTIMPSATYGIACNAIRIPRNWYVKITGTIANLAITAVPC